MFKLSNTFLLTQKNSNGIPESDILLLGTLTQRSQCIKATMMNSLININDQNKCSSPCYDTC